MWDLIISVPGHCLSFYSGNKRVNLNTGHVSLTMLKIDRTTAAHPAFHMI